MMGTDKPFNVVCKTKNINSKRLFKEINQLIEESVNDFIVESHGLIDKTYDYSQLAHFVDLYIQSELVQNKVIRQYDVICDERNNDPLVVRKGTIRLLIKFVQYDCLNITQLDYTFSKN